jgi:ketosteroid isomerase-like protein
MKLNIILITSVTALAASVHAQSEADAAAQSKSSPWSNCGTRHKSGTKALDSNIDDAIVLVNDEGSVQTKAEFLASVKSSISQPNAQQQRVAPEWLAVRGFGNMAIATGVMRVKGTENGKSYRRERFVDTWLKKGGGWVSRRHERYACPGLEASSAQSVHQRDASHSSRNHR